MRKIKRFLQIWGWGVIVGNGVMYTYLGALYGAVKMFMAEGSIWSFFILTIALGSSIALATLIPKLIKYFFVISEFLVEN